MISTPSDSQVLSQIKLRTAASDPMAQQILDWLADLNHPPLAEPLIWWQCQTAFKEAFDNIVEHAHAGLPLNTPIEIEVIRRLDCIQMRLWDCGPGFDLKQQLLEMPDLLENQSDRGRGLQLINRIVDQWSYTRTEDERNCFFMLKTFNPERPQEA